MKNKKIAVSILVTAGMLLLAGATAFAKGADETSATTPGKGPEVEDPGIFRIWATLDQYEQETGNQILEFSESPALRARAEAGELPAVEKRLPAEPLVIKPLDEIGMYGGDIRVPAVDPVQALVAHAAASQHLLKLAPDLTTVVPNIAKGWQFSDDYSMLTLFLRKGMRWSDGNVFTADDIVFWYDDIILNEKLTANTPKWFAPGGEPAKLEKVDDYTVRIQFAVPYPPIMNRFSDGNDIFVPKHFLKQYHIKYNPQAEKIAREESYDSWWQAFNFHSELTSRVRQELDLPTLNTWALESISPEQEVYVRNPYFWKIDVAGNQLPYVDRQIVVFVGNVEVVKLKTIAGEFSFAAQLLHLNDYPLYKEGEQKGGYRVMLWQNPLGSNVGFGFNPTHKDPVLRELFNDIRFKRAISLSINRGEINQVHFQGRGTSRQATTPPDATFYEDWMGEYWGVKPFEK